MNRLNLESLPWAIITDRKNDYTSIFDKVIILESPTYSYMDKITMLKEPPFEENIFIDADCLIYGNINNFFSLYPRKGVAHFGYIVQKDQKGRGWFDLEDIGDWGSIISYKIQTHGGVIFFKRDEVTANIYQTCLEITQHYFEYHFKEFDKPADEPIIALSMCVHNCTPVDGFKENMCFFRVNKHICDINITKGLLCYLDKYSKSIITNVPLIHWGNVETKSWIYKREIFRLNQSPFELFVYIIRIIEYCKIKYYFLKSYSYFLLKKKL